MSDAANAVRIRDFTKRYKGETAVDRLTLDVPTGSVFGLLGENGAGKTTTLRTLLGLLAADGGSLEVLGLDPMKKGLEVRRRVGYVPEQPALYEWMTVAESRQPRRFAPQGEARPLRAPGRPPRNVLPPDPDPPAPPRPCWPPP